VTDHYDPEGNPITIEEWALLYEKRGSDPDTSWWQKSTYLGSGKRGVHVSTVWLGMNHQWGDGPPLIYESMVFGGPMDQEMWRYATKEEAWEHHDVIVQMVQEASRFLFVDDEGS
jgi:hypothetical protein